MVKHIILWNLKDEYSDEKKEEIKSIIKEKIEGLMGEIPGLLEIKVVTEKLSSSSADLMLDSTFTDADALKAYAVDEKHQAVANGYVRPHTASRSCLDFEI